MNKYISIYFYGAIIILVGFFLLLSEYYTFKTINTSIGIALTIAAFFAFSAAFTRYRKQVQFAYHEMHAVAILVYGVSILLFSHSLEILKSFTAFIFIFYTFSEIIFSNWLYNLGQKVFNKIVFIRFLLGLAIGFGTAIAMSFTDYTLEIFGVLFILVGLNIMLYIPVIKGKEASEIQNESNEL
jgi:hypothetical protein